MTRIQFSTIFGGSKIRGPGRSQDRDGDFERALSLIHGISPAESSLHQSGGVEMDTRRAEMLAMFDAYLGADYDRDKVEQVLSWQDKLQRHQAELLSKYEIRAIDATEYVQQSNKAVLAVFKFCEQVLGEADFRELFGAGPENTGGYIDLEEFLRAEVSQSHVP